MRRAIESDPIKFVVRVFTVIIAVAVVIILAISRKQEEPDYTQFNSAQLSWIIEGTQKKIVDLEEKIDYLQRLQSQKLFEEKFGPNPSPGLYIIDGKNS